MLELHPVREVIEEFSTPLNDGERDVLDRLEDALAPLEEQWHLAVQPSLPGAMPDFVLWAEHHGVTVIEVKDWNPAHYALRNGAIYVLDAQGWSRTNHDPIYQAYRYQHFIANHYVFRPGNLPGAMETFRFVRAVVMMPRFDRHGGDHLLKGATRLPRENAQHVRVCGAESLDHTKAWAFDHLRYGRNDAGPGLERRTQARLTSRFQSHAAILEQGQPLPLNSQTRTIAEQPPTRGFRRVRGSAGSGKTVALAARAVRAASEHDRILVLCFNITLAHYIQDLVRRDCRALRVDHKRITCTYFHNLLRWEVLGADCSAHPDQWPRLAQEMLERNPLAPESRFEAILVDEGQDFDEDWWLLLRKHFLAEDGEMLLVADTGQDIYDRKSWVDEGRMPGAGFSGPWMELSGSQRMPTDVAQVAAAFLDRFLSDTPPELRPEPPQERQLTMEVPTPRAWFNVRDDDACVETAVAQVRAVVSGSDAPPHGDVVVLASHSAGLRACRALEQPPDPIEVEHIFTELDDDERRRRKHAFWAGVNEIKGSTVHSFKGWEASTILLMLTDDMTTGDAARLAYVGMTRLRHGHNPRLIVVNSIDVLADFESAFPATEN